jgi:hypothetical protein
MADFGIWDAYLGISGDFRTESPDVQTLQTGLYYRVNRNLKAGLFYSLQRGERHDDDWIRPEGDWLWKDSSDRLESILTADLSPRFLLPRLPGRNWIITSRFRYSYNLDNNHQSLQFRPDLGYFLMKRRQPLWNFNAAYALYFPLNFSEVPLYEHGPYLAALYHYSPEVKLELSAEYRMRYWTASSEFADAGGSYTIRDDSLRLGAALIWSPDF